MAVKVIVTDIGAFLEEERELHVWLIIRLSLRR